MPDDRYPTEKQWLYLEALKECNFDRRKIKECKRKAGYSEKTSIAIVERGIKERVREGMEQAGMTIGNLTMEHAKQVFSDATPEGVRKQSLDMAYKLGDYFPATKIDLKSQTKSFNFTVPVESLRDAEKLTGEDIIDVEPTEDEDDGDSDSLKPL